ncbi:DUF1330 domain-containing protein [Novosphingobium sp. Gsoil 351]|uniref:DUF1330 domain-containing protein n=1 Tax=Novosphingobium sp. Gsoil 351 TaxID=2675225 RepID=UPI0012B47D95|nr:DUF1330 domain-containing protein [Novosphingobium sp. Gsoil 351]QGN53524.1 DUF1330 domain-containing protein [Novosphingobium sp. Gsoil 351]
MPAFVVACFDITDPAGYEAYRPAVLPTLQAHGCEVLAADYASQTIEGQPGHVTVILKFASKAAATAWYESPEYQAIKSLRTDNSQGTVVLVDAWSPSE